MKGVFDELVYTLKINWSNGMYTCAYTNQIPYFEDNLVPNETWIGKAEYIMNWGKVNHCQFIKSF